MPAELISAEDQKYLRELFEKELRDRIKITYFTQKELTKGIRGPECSYCRETEQILETVASLSDRIDLEVLDFLKAGDRAKEMGIDKIPGFVLQGAGPARLRFFGIPSGYEFSAIIEDIIYLSRGINELSPRTKEALAAIDQDHQVQVFVTPI